MAKAEWIIVSPSSYSGDAIVNVTSTSEHTGRNVRTTTLTWKAANVSDVIRRVNQAGKPEYVDIDDSASSDKGGKIVTIHGVSNSAKLTFSLGTGDLQISLPTSYVANSLTTNNGSLISGDPGALSEYPFSITINCPANDDIKALSRQIIVEDGAGNRDVFLCDYGATTNGRLTFDEVGRTDRLTIDFNKNVITVNGVTKERTKSTFQSEYNLYLFAGNLVGVPSWFNDAKLYSCKIYDNDKLVRDFIPCKNSSQKDGLYDTVTKSFFPLIEP